MSVSRPIRRLAPCLAVLALWTAGGCCGEACDPDASVVAAPLRLRGQLSVTGLHDPEAEGGVLLRLVEQESGRVLLRRVYDLGDPAWQRSEGRCFLYYSLSPEFAFDAEAPIRAPLVVEALHLPPGVAAVPQPFAARAGRSVDLDGSEVDLALPIPAAVASGRPKDTPAAPR
jgi:hypothetical protein